MVQQVRSIEKPRPKHEEAKKLTRVETEEDDVIFKPLIRPKNGSMIDRVGNELQSKIASELTLQLIDKKKELYLFGTRKVNAQMINDHLMVRVGGGFMPFD